MSSGIWPFANPPKKIFDNPRWAASRVETKIRKHIDPPMDKAIAQRYYGTTTSTIEILSGKAYIKAAQMRTDYERPATLDKEVYKLRQVAETSIDQPLPDDKMNAFVEKYNEQIMNPKYAIKGAKKENVPEKYKDNVFSRQILFHRNLDNERTVEPYEMFPELEELVENVGKILKQYYGSHYEVVQGRTYRTYPVPDELLEHSEAYANYWHADGCDIDHIKVFVLLNDVTADHGPFTYLSRADTKRLSPELRRYENGLPNGFVEQKANKIKRFTGEAGSAMLCNTNMLLHRAGLPKEGKQRDLLLLQFKPSAKQPAEGDHYQGRSGSDR